MSDFSDEMVATVRRVVYRQMGVSKSAESGALLEAVLDGAVRPLAETISRQQALIEGKCAYNDRMIAAMNEPPGAITPGPGPMRHQEPFTPYEWHTVRIRQESRYE